MKPEIEAAINELREMIQTLEGVVLFLQGPYFKGAYDAVSRLPVDITEEIAGIRRTIENMKIRIENLTKSST